MFDKVIVGVDGREGGRDALAFAAALARVSASTLVAVRAYPYETHPSRASVRGFEEQIRSDTLADLERELTATDVVAEPLVVGDVSPARALQHAAEHKRAGLIVVGSSHRGRLGRVLAGNVAVGALHHAPCPVAVAPRGFAERAGQLKSIGVGFDGGAESREALRLAAKLAKASGARVEVRSVATTPVAAEFPAAYEAEWIERMRQYAREHVDEALGIVDELGAEGSGEIVIGSPVEELVEFSRGVDVLVVGSRGWGPVRRLLLGSTAERLVREASCAVIVVPRAAATQQREAPDPAAAARA
ncbi:MAG TPA: universal stress protein [Solirubrobacteraceae bacterium]